MALRGARKNVCVLARGFRVVDGAGADDDQKSIVTLVKDVGDSLARSKDQS